ncbi:hypothetical protein EXU48_06720 [Occultella glacieicola]|uniref:Uncharacterized protein n=1 Tax=Occultella glacieicola TaxID=2518684 RepID=A0ABY2E5T3_9MICO|nr:hypothetical protein [Occultella glacieicola]TDE95939.1 hypothetical protein EXU48_06720 [Occultella glacieicola]
MQDVAGAGPIMTWVVVGLVLLALAGIAIGTAARRSGRAVRWHDEANTLADQGAEVVDAVRIWGQHVGAAGPEVWSDLEHRTDTLTRSAQALRDRATTVRPRELAEQAATTTGSLRRRMTAYAAAQADGSPSAARTELLAAADELDRALAALRTAV